MVWGDGQQAIHHPTGAYLFVKPGDCCSLDSHCCWCPVILNDWTPLRKRRRKEGLVVKYLKQMERREERREAEQQAKRSRDMKRAKGEEEEARRREEEFRAREENREKRFLALLDALVKK